MAQGDPWERILAAFEGQRPVEPLWVCQVSARTLSVSGAAIAEMSDVNRRETVCATDEVAEQLEDLQFGLGEGPCMQAVGTGSPVLVSDIREATSSRWPVFAEAASRTPARAMYCFPLQIGAISVGVFDLYRDRPGPLTPAELAGALLFADVALWTLLDLRARPDLEATMSEHPLAELGLHRAEIHQATGMVMVQLGASAETALARLRAYAYAQSRSLEDIARQVVSRQLRLAADDE